MNMKKFQIKRTCLFCVLNTFVRKIFIVSIYSCLPNHNFLENNHTYYISRTSILISTITFIINMYIVTTIFYELSMKNINLMQINLHITRVGISIVNLVSISVLAPSSIFYMKWLEHTSELVNRSFMIGKPLMQEMDFLNLRKTAYIFNTSSKVIALCFLSIAVINTAVFNMDSLKYHLIISHSADVHLMYFSSIILSIKVQKILFENIKTEISNNGAVLSRTDLKIIFEQYLTVEKSFQFITKYQNNYLTYFGPKLTFMFVNFSSLCVQFIKHFDEVELRNIIDLFVNVCYGSMFIFVIMFTLWFINDIKKKVFIKEFNLLS